jgi:hypothetical protein
MPIRERQKLITEIVAQVLNVCAEPDKSFVWFKNVHTSQDFGAHYPLIDRIFQMLGGNPKANKGVRSLNCDAYLGDSYNFMFEFDEYQHFSTPRLKTLEMYPADLPVAYDIQKYQAYCRKHYAEADKYRHAKTTTDFNFVGGRTAQRAYLDCFRDILPSLHGLRPTLRISEFEVAGVVDNNTQSRALVEQLLEKKLSHVQNSKPL